MKLATLFHSHNLERTRSWPTTHSDLFLAAAMQFQWCLRYCSTHICESQSCFDPLQLARLHFVHIVVWLLQFQLHLLEWNVCLSPVTATSLNFILGTFYTLFELTVGLAKGTDTHLIYDLLPFIALNQPSLALTICARHTSDYLVHYFQRSPLGCSAALVHVECRLVHRTLKLYTFKGLKLQADSHKPGCISMCWILQTGQRHCNASCRPLTFSVLSCHWHVTSQRWCKCLDFIGSIHVLYSTLALRQ